MITVPVFTINGERAGELELAMEIFGVEPNASLVHQSVVATLANQRQGTASTKTRGEVHHTTRKLFRQKGTGRARQGMRSAPHWKGGGVVFGPHPRDYSVSLPKKMRRKALLCALSSKMADERVKVVESFPFEKPCTKDAVALLRALGLENKKILIVFDDVTEAAVYSFRNLPKVLLTTVEMVGTYDVLSCDFMLITKDGINQLQELKQQPLGIHRWMAEQQQEGGAE